MFQEGTAGFKGGRSAENYIAIAKTSRATCRTWWRKVHDYTGERRYTRYGLNYS